MSNYVSKLKWAWQAQFLSYVRLILRNNLLFEDKQMILLSLFDISTGFRFQKNLKSFPIQVLSHLWVIQNECYTFGHFRCKMAFFTRVWQKVKELPHLFSIKILLENEETFQMRYNMFPNSQWFQKYKPSKLKEQDVNPSK